MESDTAATGLALLPLLGAGYSHTVKSRYQDSVRRGIYWLVEHQQPDGNLFIGPPGMAYMYSHAIGTMALCEAYGLSQDPRLKKPAQLAIQFIIDSQNPITGGWRYSPGQEGRYLGLRLADVRPPQRPHGPASRSAEDILKGCSRYLDLAAVDQHRIELCYQPGRRGLSVVMTAEALLSRQLLGWPRNYPPLVKGASQIAADLETLRRPEHLLLVLRDPAPAQHEEQGLGAVEPQGPRGPDRHAGQGGTAVPRGAGIPTCPSPIVGGEGGAPLH